MRKFTKTQIDDFVNSFCCFFYQSIRGNILHQSEEIEVAIYDFMNLLPPLDNRTLQTIENELRKLIDIKNKEVNCFSYFKKVWIEESEKIIELLNCFKYDDIPNLDDEQKYEIIKKCEPLFLTYKIYEDESEFDKFIKLYYDIGKKNQNYNEKKTSNHIYITPEAIFHIVDDYIKIHAKKDYESTYCQRELRIEVPLKVDIVHLLNIYAKKLYGSHKNIQPVFRKLFDNNYINLKKADNFTPLIMEPSSNPFEI